MSSEYRRPHWATYYQSFRTRSELMRYVSEQWKLAPEECQKCRAYLYDDGIRRRVLRLAFSVNGRECSAYALWCGDCWVVCSNPVMPLYRHSELLAGSNRMTFLVFDEDEVHALESLGFLSTTTGSVHNRDTEWSALYRRAVCVLRHPLDQGGWATQYVRIARKTGALAFSVSLPPFSTTECLIDYAHHRLQEFPDDPGYEIRSVVTPAHRKYISKLNGQKLNQKRNQSSK